MVEVIFVLGFVVLVFLVSHEHFFTLLNFSHELRKDIGLRNLDVGLRNLWCAIHVEI